MNTSELNNNSNLSLPRKIVRRRWPRMSTQQIMAKLASPPPMMPSALGCRIAYLRPKTKCADGFEMSVQASALHYCEPHNDKGPYTHFELGCLSAFEPLLADYYGDEDDPKSVLGFVPFSVVEAVINKHGGPA